MNSLTVNQKHKTSVNLSLGLCENASVIPSTFIAGDGINCKIANALIFALLRTDNQISSNDDMLQLAVPDFYSRNKSIAVFPTLLIGIFETVRTRYSRKDKSFNENTQLNNTVLLTRVLADAILFPYTPNITILPPLYSFIGYKNSEMCTITNKLLEPMMLKENITYFEPFCGSASLFLSLPLQKRNY